MPPEFSRVKFKLIVLLLYYIHCHSTRAAYPLERDVAELTGVSPPKRWIPFMERLAKICLNELKAKESMTFTDALKCMTIRDTFQINKFSQCSRSLHTCTLTHVYPNILKVQIPGFPIQIIVHREFSLNITLKYGHHVEFGILGKRYTEQNFSTIMILNNSAKIEFFRAPEVYISEYIFQYSIAQKVNTLIYDRVRASVMIFLWGYFQVTYFQIKVDIRARLSLDKIMCLFCKLIVYDGPNENLPIIAKMDNADRLQRVVASTFQVFVAVIENVPKQHFLVTYTTIYINEGVFNLTEYDNIELIFDNNTSCYGHSWYARSCVYTFYTSTHKQIRLSLKRLQFTKHLRNNRFIAGIIIFNHFHGTTESILELHYSVPANIEIIGTGYIMHIMIFIYSIFESLTCTFAFSLSLSDCDVLLVSGNYISYSGYVTASDDTLRVFQMNRSLQTLLEYDRCLRLQFIMPSSVYKMIFPNSAPLLIAENFRPMCYCSKFPVCQKSWEGPSHVEYKIRHDRMKIRTVDSVTIEPCGNYDHIVIHWLQCNLPCQYIFNGNHCGPRFETKLVVYDDNDNSICDICKNVYIECLPMGIPLATTVSYALLIKSNVCLYGELRIIQCTHQFPSVSLAFNTSMFKMPVFSSEICALIFSEMCHIEIPLVGTTSFLNWPDYMPGWSARDVMDLHWDGVLYRRLSRFPVTWEEAILACQEIGASLLTIHSLTEYQFIKETFLKIFDMAIFYVGVKREVMHIICEYNAF